MVIERYTPTNGTLIGPQSRLVGMIRRYRGGGGGGGGEGDSVKAKIEPHNHQFFTSSFIQNQNGLKLYTAIHSSLYAFRSSFITIALMIRTVMNI